jgi:hypothetical protein
MFRADELTVSESVEAQSAKNYALVGFVFYVLGLVGWIGLMWFFFSFLSVLRGPPFNVDLSGVPITFGFFPFVIPVGVFFALTAGFTVWSLVTMDNIGKGKYAEARTASLVLGIFGIFLAWIIGGIFLLLAYGRLGDAMRGTEVSRVPPQGAARICTNCGKPVGRDAKFCGHCGRQLD